MKKRNITRARLNVYLKPETLERIKAFGLKIGMTQTGVASLAIEAGLDALFMSFDPKFREFFDRMAENADYTANGSKSPE